MAIGYNSVTLMGNVGKDPQVSEGESLRASFSLAVDRSRTDDNGERIDQTDWFMIVTWGRLAEICRDYLAKGSWVLVSGRIQTRRWQDSKNQWHNITEIVAREIILLSGQEQENPAFERF